MTPYLHHILLPGLLLGAIGTIGILSFVFKENKLYRFFEHLFLGLAAGYSLAVTWTDILRPLWWDPMVRDGIWEWALVVPLSFMFYGIYTKKYSWLARVIFGAFFGLAAGQVFQIFASEYIPQVRASFKPLIPHGGATPLSWNMAINNWMFLAILICVVTYFFFAFEQNSKPVQRTALAGRWILMISLGAIFGATIMTREALLIDRIRFLLFDWLQLNRFFAH